MIIDKIGKFINVKDELFSVAKSGLYIDKTGLLSFLNSCIHTLDCYACVCRPRRFGKTLAASMLSTYYMHGEDSKELFEGLKISRDDTFEKHMNKYNVISINMSHVLSDNNNSISRMLKDLEESLIAEIKEKFNYSFSAASTRAGDLLNEVYIRERVGFVIIIDEWDCVIRDVKNDAEGHKAYYNFLRNLLKNRNYVYLAYMTGILPIKVYGGSALNMFTEFSMVDPKGLSEFVGFTESEVIDLCQARNGNFTEAKKWYDGYRMDSFHVYSPYSVITALRFDSYASHWTETETYETLEDYINLNFDNLKETIVKMYSEQGGAKKINVTKFQKDLASFKSADSVLTLLVHLGYLGFNKYKSEVFIPNFEVMEQFRNTFESTVWEGYVELYRNSRRLLEDTWGRNSSAVAKAIERAHEILINKENYNSEQALSYVVTWSYIHARTFYHELKELQSGKGYIDILFLPKHEHSSKLPILIELKWNSSAKSAIEQIEAKDYTVGVEELMGLNILLVGINYSSTTKKHTCSIKEFEIK
jgi:hypothetical protein